MAGATLVERRNFEFLNVVVPTLDADNENTLQDVENEILQLGQLYKKQRNADELARLIKAIRPFLGRVSKAKAAKLVKSLVDLFLDLEAGVAVGIDLCVESIEWAKKENRTFLRQALEARLIALYFDNKMYSESLQLCCDLLKELKRIDDKNLLVEVLLVESKTFHALSNLSKARASLTSARTTANAIYCPPKLQAALDLQSGILHAADEGDFKTAFSYFYEAFEGFDSIESVKALTSLKYMLLSKIMLNLADDVPQIVSGKLALKYSGGNIDAMKCVAKASSRRSLAEFEAALASYKEELEGDPIVTAHLGTLYDNLLQQNLCRIIEPYSRVRVDFVARKINLTPAQVEKKLSHMILDKKIRGVLDQAESVLIIYEETTPPKIYQLSIDIVDGMMDVIDTLYEKAKKLN